MKLEYKTLEFSNLKLLDKWMNNWACLGWKVVTSNVVFNRFGGVDRYTVIMEREIND